MGERTAGRPPSAVGPYYRTYEARDGYMVIACLNNRLRRSVREVLGIDDPRVDGEEFNVLALGEQRAQEIMHECEAIIATKSVADWCALLDEKGVPAGPVRLPAEMFEDQHVIANNLVVELDHPVVGKIKMANSPLKMSAADTGATTAPPALGQHTREYLSEIGFRDRRSRSVDNRGRGARMGAGIELAADGRRSDRRLATDSHRFSQKASETKITNLQKPRGPSSDVPMRFIRRWAADSSRRCMRRL